MLKITKFLYQVSNIHNFARLSYSTATTLELKNVPENGDLSSNVKTIKNDKETISHNNMVAAAFASLQINENINEIQTPQTDSRISSASTVHELLSVSEGSPASRKHALKVVSVLADWTLNGKAKLPDFETDPRFIKLCRVLTRTNNSNNNNKYVRNAVRSEDISTILHITADDEAAKLVAGLTLSQMVKVMKSLTNKRRRSMILLRALSFNILRSTEVLDIKQCGDLLYCMSTLNFFDENLVQRVCFDVCKDIGDDLQKSSVLGSILTSLGLMKYKDIGVLETSCQWILKHADLCRSQDIFAFFLTIAILNYEPPNADDLFAKLIPQVNVGDALKPSVWLDLIWSLVFFNRATAEHIRTVLSEEFLNKLNTENEQSIAHKLKLLNIDSAAEILIPSYNGPRLQTSSHIRNVDLLRSKEKEEMSLSIVECLKNLMSEKHMKMKINTGMGFYIDVECFLDNKCNPILPEKFQSLPQQRKIAILAYDYHDMCKGSSEPTGINVLAVKLLEAKGYRVLQVPYTDYKAKDKLVDRVQYLELKLKNIVL